MVSTKKMTVKEWILVEPNPIQRDTEKHAAKAKHLKKYDPTHDFVFAAELPSGKLLKLDGHTRSLLWSRNQLQQPSMVIVGIIPVKDRAEAELRYKNFDSKDALETMRDKVTGAYSKYNFQPQSALLQSGNIVTALRMAYGVIQGGTVNTFTAGGAREKGEKGKDKRSPMQLAVAGADVYDLFNEFSYELTTLDGFGLRQGQIKAGIMSAFLLSYRKYGHKVTPFWGAVFAGQGSKINGAMDAIQALCELILGYKTIGSRGGRAHAADLCARALMCVEKWLKNDELFQTPRPIDTLGYLEGHKQPTERLIKKNDVGKRVNA